MLVITGGYKISWMNHDPHDFLGWILIPIFRGTFQVAQEVVRALKKEVICRFCERVISSLGKKSHPAWWTNRKSDMDSMVM